MRPLALLLLPLGVSLFAPTAHAFRTAATFDDPAAEGGGGARHFTGSVQDGYTCAVCHRGREPDPVELTGLPLEGYVPGGAYEIEIIMPNAPASSLALELTDELGGGVGSLALPAAPAGPELCTTGDPATSRVSLGDRAVIAMNACGAQRVRAIWTAPDQPLGPVWFHAVVVTGDDNSDTEGDGVEEIAHVIPVAGASAEAARVGTSACSAARGAPSRLAWLLLPVLWLLARRRRA